MQFVLLLTDCTKHLHLSYLIASCGVAVARMQRVHEGSSDAQRVRAPSAQQKPERRSKSKKGYFTLWCVTKHLLRSEIEGPVLKKNGGLVRKLHLGLEYYETPQITERQSLAREIKYR